MRSNPFSMPTHPTLRHPRTGDPLRAIWVRPDGRAMWPIMGGSETPPEPTPPAPVPTPPPAPTPPGPGPDKDLGFPKDTPVAEMTAEQQAAYWKHNARKHETRYKDVVGDRTSEDIKNDLAAYAEIQKQQMTPAEQALTAAREEGKTEALKTEREKTATAIFRAALETSGVEGDDLDDLTSNFNVANFIGDDGVDTTKITNFAKRFSPSGTDTPPKRRDFGGGRRDTPGGANDTFGSKGKAEAQKRFGKKTTSGE